MAQAGEDAEHLDVALHAHPLEVAVEVGELRTHGQAELLSGFPVADQHVEDEVLVPADVGVLEQRHQVVGDRAVDGVLEVDDAGVGAEAV